MTSEKTTAIVPMALRRASERSLHQRVCRDLKRLGVYYHKAMAVSLRGIPDIICCVNGRFIALELKRDERAVASELQKYAIEKISESRGIALIVTPKTWSDIYGQIISIHRSENVFTTAQDTALRLISDANKKISKLQRLQKYPKLAKGRLLRESSGECPSNVAEEMGRDRGKVHKNRRIDEDIPVF